ncbi:hypothetical protein [Desulfotomaculum copahuensis]|uniref:Uncharacterized protein n=1 Tax=Desulfotomaculum copahuensis TaxID=1838280 RepID=A0A1B7LDF8_9FIRM|nr:hypothetical protein [Desulfotomaculum copahuensis]OAT81130.1 hypothetical protein A6M21_12040 [Desulfotomaculum copahuensis]
MQTQVTVIQYCPLAERDVCLDEIYLVEATGACQVHAQLIHRECLEKTDCPDGADCPLQQEYSDNRGV